MSKDAPKKPLNVPYKICTVCPDCGAIAELAAKQKIENTIMAFTYKCPKGHHFSHKLNVK